jgi:predicted metal-dependent phosphoesterase TrpH
MPAVEGAAMKADLHIHSHMSDGVLSPEILIRQAWEKGINVMSFTDHETVTLSPVLLEMAESYHIRLIAGCELLTSYDGHDVHVLAYFDSMPSDSFLKVINKLSEKRSQATCRLVHRLRQKGVRIDWADVLNTDFPQATRTHSHVLYGLHKMYPLLSAADLRGIIFSAFNDSGTTEPLTGYDPPAFEHTVDIIRLEGGLPVIAHPGLLEVVSLIDKLLSNNEIGLEVYYGYWYDTTMLINKYESLAKKSALVATGGSDFHGTFSRYEIGEISFPVKEVEILLNKLREISIGRESL